MVGTNTENKRLRRRLLREDRQNWRMPAQWLVTGYEAKRQRAAFADFAAYTMFLGYPRSGHTLIGSLLNAHPDVVIAHELNALRYVQWGFDRDRILALLLRRDRDFGRLGRCWSGYDYSVPGLWQGRWRELKVLGDKRGGATTRLLHRRPWLLDKLRERIRLPLRVFHHVRNPFDNIARMAAVSGATLDYAIERYFRNVDWACETMARLDRSELMHVYHERIVAEPRETLARLLAHLGVEADPGYLETCAGHVLANPRRSRDRFEWPDTTVEDVHRRIDRYPHLAGYRFID